MLCQIFNCTLLPVACRCMRRFLCITGHGGVQKVLSINILSWSPICKMYSVCLLWEIDWWAKHCIWTFETDVHIKIFILFLFYFIFYKRKTKQVKKKKRIHIKYSIKYSTAPTMGSFDASKIYLGFWEEIVFEQAYCSILNIIVISFSFLNVFILVFTCTDFE